MHRSVHAGEFGPSDVIFQAIERLGAERIVFGYSVNYTAMHCTAPCWLFEEWSVKSSVCSVLCAACNMQCVMCSVKCAVCNMQCVI